MLCYCVASKIRTSTLPLCSSPGIDSFEGKLCGFTEVSEREEGSLSSFFDRTYIKLSVVHLVP